MESQEIVVEIAKHVKVEYLILIPFLFCLGEIIKKTKKLADEMIPITLLVVGIAFAILLGLKTNQYVVDSIIQGVISCFSATWGYNAVTQILKLRKED